MPIQSWSSAGVGEQCSTGAGFQSCTLQTHKRFRGREINGCVTSADFPFQTLLKVPEKALNRDEISPLTRIVFTFAATNHMYDICYMVVKSCLLF